MARRKRGAADLTGIRQRGGTYQVRIFGGTDPVTGKQVILTGSADSQDAAIELRDKYRTQVRERTAVRTGVTLGYLLDEWLAGHQVEATTRASYSLYVERFIRPALGDQTLARLAAERPAGRQSPAWHGICHERAPRKAGAEAPPSTVATGVAEMRIAKASRGPRAACSCCVGARPDERYTEAT